MDRLARFFVVLFLVGLYFPLSIARAQTPASPSAQTVRGETVFMDKEIMTIRVPVIIDRLILGDDDIKAFIFKWYADILSQVKITNQQIKLPKLSDYALRFFSAATKPLAPQVIQDRTIHALDNPKRKFYVTGRLCIYRPDGTFFTDVISQTDISTESDNPENAIEFGEASKFLGAAYGRGKVTQTNNQYDYTKPELTIKINEPLECDAAINTNAVVTNTDKSGGSNTFNIPAIITNIFSIWGPFGLNLLCSPNNPFKIQCVDYHVRYKGTTLNPWVANTHCNIDGCNDSELSNVDYPVAVEDKQSGGLANTFRPQVLSYTTKLNGGDPAQLIDAADHQSIPGESALSFQGSLQDNSKGIMCSILPKQLQTESCQFATNSLSCDEAFKNPPVEKTAGGGNGGFNPSMTYSIPYRDSSCKIDASKVEALANFAASWSNLPGTDKTKAAANVRQYWQTIHNYALQYEWNPAFIMALWIEESAAGGVPAWQMGCTYRYNQQNGSWTKLPRDSSTCEQLACLMAYPQQPPDDFYRFMCSYNTTAQTPGTNQCPPYASWNFAQSIRLSYERVSDILGLSSPCRIRTH